MPAEEDPGDQDQHLRPVHPARAGQHPPRAGDEPHRRRVPHAAAHVPLARQLLHDRLVHAVAGGRAALGGGHQADRRRDVRPAGPQRVARGNVQDHPPVGRDQVDRVPRAVQALQLRNADELPRAAGHVQDDAHGQAQGAGQAQVAARGGARQAAHDQEERREDAGRAHGAAAAAREDAGRGGRDDGADHHRQGERRGDQPEAVVRLRDVQAAVLRGDAVGPSATSTRRCRRPTRPWRA